jgi:hypothetical protein
MALGSVKVVNTTSDEVDGFTTANAGVNVSVILKVVLVLLLISGAVKNLDENCIIK